MKYIDDLSFKQIFNFRKKIIDYSIHNGFEETLQKALDDMVALLRCLSGYYLIFDEKNEIVYRLAASVTPEQTDSKLSKQFFFQTDLNASLQTCLDQKKSLINNQADFYLHHHSPTLSNTIKSELVVPVLRNNDVVAILGLSSAESDFSHSTVEHVELYGDLTWELFNGLREKEQLSNRYDFLLSTFDTIQDGLSIIDTDFNIIKVNQWMHEMYPEPISFGKTKCYQLFHHRNSICENCPSQKAFQSGKSEHAIVPYFDKGWVRVDSFPFISDSGQVEYIIETVKDVTEAYNADLLLKKSENQFRMLFNNLDTGLILAELVADNNNDHDFKIIDINPVFEMIFELKKSQVLGSSALQLFPDIREKWLQRLVDIALHGESAHFSENIRYHDKYLNIHAFSPQFNQCALAISDITEKQHAEQEKAALLTRLTLALQAGNMGVWEYKSESLSLYLDDRVLELFGLDKKSFRGTVEEWLEILHPDDRDRTYQKAKKSIESDDIRQCDFRVILKNGKLRYISAHAIAVRDEANQPIGAIGVLYDITEKKNAEIEILNSRQRYQDIFENSPVPLWLEDFTELFEYLNDLKKKGVTDFHAFFDIHPQELQTCAGLVKIIHVNQAAVNLHNAKSKNELIGNLHKLFTPNSLGDFKNEVVSIASGQNFFECEGEVKTLDDKLRYVFLRFRVEQGKDGRKTALLATTDITERKHYEEQLVLFNKLQDDLLGDENLQTKLNKIVKSVVKMFNSASACIWLTNPVQSGSQNLNQKSIETDFEYLNQSHNCIHLCASYGVSRDFDNVRTTFKDINIQKIFNSNEKGFFTNEVKTDPRFSKNAWIQNNDITAFAVYKLQSQEGKAIGALVMFSKHAFSLNDTALISAVAHTAAEVIQVSRSIDALRQNEKKLNTLFTTMTEIVLLNELEYDKQGKPVNFKIIECNNAFLDIIKLDKQNIIGKIATDVLQFKDIGFFKRCVTTALYKKTQHFTTAFKNFDRHFMVSLVPAQRGQFSIIATDITELVEIQKRINEKNKELEDYLYITSHDLRSPLVNIHGFSDIVEKEIKNVFAILDDQKLDIAAQERIAESVNLKIPRALEFIKKGAQKMEDLINGLLQISRTGQQKMTFEKIDMNQLLNQVKLQFKYQTDKSQANIDIDPLPFCYGDENLLNQLFSNLIDNAFKYKHPERLLDIYISAKVGEKCVYKVKDNGIGIAQEHLDRIWNAFFRENKNTTVDGEGIGLNLVKRIIEKHNGRVWVESEQGDGSTFFVELPSGPISSSSVETMMLDN